MAEDFQPSCNWWNTKSNRNMGLDVSQATSTSQPAASSVAAVAGGTMRILCDEPSSSAFQLSAFGSSADLHSNGRAESSSFHAMNQDDPFFRQVQFREMSQRLFPASASSHDCSSPMPLGHQPRFDNYQQIADHYQSQMAAYREVSNEMQQLQQLAVNKFTQQFNILPLKQQFTDINTDFWKASSGFHPTSLSSLRTLQVLETKPSCSKSTDGRGIEKKKDSEPAVKKPRTETPASPPPAFKVRKEKLGDRITLLQQLVSPFGKSDTASVLHEVIEYIKFLHDQVSALSTPYLKINEHPMQQQKNSDYKQARDGEQITRQGLRSQGLCLVPVASMAYTVASESSADFWSNPTFGGADERCIY